ncbi:3'-5' exonuclease family protein [Bifidobacterium platyrrhinorum]|uniref:Uncharacterized protein n=1 Tax=Bifidobacterium platyrrhinorum TaxID=2661628 RepID=A0A6L9SUM8_9BIFI|nr:hypothetical protein [Bifidobacterium platyrrhinorum]NEG56154.1 hypothetical protein [Bifidobacterium platyrrhinorum]
MTTIIATPPAARPDALLWLDLETTGLHTGARILETGLRCTSMDAREEIARLTLIHHITAGDLISMEIDAMRMHMDNGLLAACETMGATEDDAAADITGFITTLAVTHRLHPAGTNPQFDLTRLLDFLALQDPDLHQAVTTCLHYRRLDLTAIRLLLQAAGHNPYAGDPSTRHRVDDCLDRDIHDYRRYLSLIPPARRRDTGSHEQGL